MKFAIVLLIAIASQSVCNAELFTASAELDALLETEKAMVQIFQDYLHSEEQRLNKLRDFVGMLKMHEEKFSASRFDDLFNPVNLFLLIKHFAIDVAQRQKEVTSLNNLETLNDRLEPFRESLPNGEDLDGAAAAFVRLQDTYNLPVSRMASGQFHLNNQLSSAIPTTTTLTHIKSSNYTTQSLTAADCLLIARSLYERSDFTNTVEWALEALERDSDEPRNAKTVDRRAILDYLSFAAFEIGRISEARRFNEQLLALTESDSEVDESIASDNENNEGALNEQQVATKTQHRVNADDAIGQRALNNKMYFDAMSSDEEQQIAEERREADRERRSSDAYRQSDEFKRYQQLCRGELEPKPTVNSNRLYCDLHTNGNAPFWIIGPIRRELLSKDPLIVIFHNVLSEAECEAVQQLAKPRLHRALVHNPTTGKLETAHYRVAKNAWLKSNMNELTRRIDKRIELLTGLSISTAEELQVANYGLAGQYEPHFDFARRYEIETFREHAGNRIATFMFYLSDVSAGGATVFTDLRVRAVPERGAALFWFNLQRSGEGDYRTRHAACPVLVGSKWVANKWFHEGGQEFLRPCALSPNE